MSTTSRRCLATASMVLIQNRVWIWRRCVFFVRLPHACDCRLSRYSSSDLHTCLFSTLNVAALNWRSRARAHEQSWMLSSTWRFWIELRLSPRLQLKATEINLMFWVPLRHKWNEHCFISQLNRLKCHLLIRHFEKFCFPGCWYNFVAPRTRPLCMSRPASLSTSPRLTYPTSLPWFCIFKEDVAE